MRITLDMLKRVEGETRVVVVDDDNYFLESAIESFSRLGYIVRGFENYLALSEELDTLIQEGIVAVAVDGDQGISHNKLSDGEYTVQLIRNRVEALKPDQNPLIISNSSRGFIDGADVGNSMDDGSYGLIWLIQQHIESLNN